MPSLIETAAERIPNMSRQLICDCRPPTARHAQIDVKLRQRWQSNVAKNRQPLRNGARQKRRDRDIGLQRREHRLEFSQPLIRAQQSPRL